MADNRFIDYMRQGDETFLTTKVDAVLNWGRKYSMFLYPFVTACCGMEFMSVAGSALRPRPLRLRAAALLAAPVGPADGGRHHLAPAGADAEEGLRPDGRAEVGDRVRRLHLLGRSVQQLRDGPGHRHDHPRRHLHPRLPAAARGRARRPDQAPGARAGRARPGRRPAPRDRRPDAAGRAKPVAWFGKRGRLRSRTARARPEGDTGAASLRSRGDRLRPRRLRRRDPRRAARPARRGDRGGPRRRRVPQLGLHPVEGAAHRRRAGRAAAQPRRDLRRQSPASCVSTTAR